MLEQIAFGFQLVVPLFLVMLVGGLFRQRKIVSDTGFRDLNYMVFHLFLPSNVFYSIATADRSHLFEPVFGILILAGLLIPFFLGLYLVPKLISTPAKRGVVSRVWCGETSLLSVFPYCSVYMVTPVWNWSESYY